MVRNGMRPGFATCLSLLTSVLGSAHVQAEPTPAPSAARVGAQESPASAAQWFSSAHTLEARYEAPPSTPVRSEFWRALRSPAQHRAEQLVRQGRALLYPALGLGMILGLDGATQRRVAIESALVRFERALELAPDHLEARLLLGKALASWEKRSAEGSELKSAQAIAVLEALRARDPLYEAQEVAFQLGLLRSRNAELELAAREYERALHLLTDPADQATLLGNLAEITMARGDLPHALALYERAIHVGQDENRVLALWGSAVALDRLGEHAAAIARARRALREDRVPFAALRQNGVFFVPAYEAHYYEALGALALADTERESDEPLAQALSRARAWAKPRKLRELAPFARLAQELEQVGQRELARSWLGNAVTRPHPRDGARTHDEPLPSERDGRLLFWTLRAVAAFARYQAHASETGPYYEDAREHLAELERLLARSRQ